MLCVVQFSAGSCLSLWWIYIGTHIVSISLLLKRGTVNNTGNGNDWVIDSQLIQIARTLLAVKGYLFWL